MHDELAPMSTAELMDRAIEAYRRSFWKQLAFAAMVGVVAAVASVVVGIVTVVGIVFSQGFEDATFAETLFGVLGLFLIVLLPIYLIWMGTSSAGHILLTRRALYGHLLQLPQIKIHVMALRAVTAIVAQVLVFAPLLALLFFAFRSFLPPLVDTFAVDIQDFVPSTSFIVLLTLASIAVAIAILFLANVFALSVSVAIFEGRLFFSSLIRSWQLMKDDFLKIFGIRLLWYMVAVLLSVSAQGLVALMWAAIGALAGTAPIPLYMFILPIGLISNMISFIVSFAILPMDGIMQAVIYFNQCTKKEGLSIELRLTMLMQKRRGL